LAQREPAAVPVIGWVGTHSTFPYVKSIFPVLERVVRDVKFRLRLGGTGEDNVVIPGVEIENWPWKLEREISDFQSLDIGVYPIVEDDWSVGKSCFKAVQYMAVGIPFVVSPVGACQDIAEINQTHFVARTDDEWYEHLSRLLRDEALRRQMGANGRKYAVQHYSIDAHVQKLADALRSVIF
jgi:glycosyltransferase involved in cell wall biosynthesis